MSSALSEKALDWKNLQPHLQLTHLPQNTCDFFDLQNHAKTAITTFLQHKTRQLLVLKADNAAEYAPLVEQFIAQVQPKSVAHPTESVKYIIEQGDSFSFPKISIEKTAKFSHLESDSTENFAPAKYVATALYLDPFQLFGTVQVHSNSQELQLNAGLLHQLNNGVLILSVSAILAQFDVWLRLKHILQTKQFDWHSAHPFKALPCQIPSYPLNLKMILLGNRTELAALADLEENLYGFADYAEIESYAFIDGAKSEENWGKWVCQIAKENQVQLTLPAIEKLYQLLVRESEDRNLISISPYKIADMLNHAQLLAPNQPLSADHFEQVFLQKSAQHSFLREQTYADILNEQIYIDTENEIIGQINGLSVIEYPGTPVSFGEPSRISCIIQFGDGEVIDVERKNELAGNIHGKGMMIAETCLANILALPTQLPFSASLAFEQSYGEIDGDSASLAAFCVLVSSLADIAIPQSIAITGAIDQFGLVHAVGGVNEKVESFFTICQRRGLTGKQGVIIPAAVIQQLSLSQELVSAVENQQFFIFPVEDVYQTCEIIFQRDLLDEEENKVTEQDDNLSIAKLIQQRIAYHSEPTNRGLFSFLFRK